MNCKSREIASDWEWGADFSCFVVSRTERKGTKRIPLIERRRRGGMKMFAHFSCRFTSLLTPLLLTFYLFTSELTNKIVVYRLCEWFVVTNLECIYRRKEELSVVKWRLKRKSRVRSESPSALKCILVERMTTKVPNRMGTGEITIKPPRISSATRPHRRIRRRSSSVRRKPCKSWRRLSRKKPPRRSNPTHGIC